MSGLPLFHSDSTNGAISVENRQTSSRVLLLQKHDSDTQRSTNLEEWIDRPFQWSSPGKKDENPTGEIHKHPCNLLLQALQSIHLKNCISRGVFVQSIPQTRGTGTLYTISDTEKKKDTNNTPYSRWSIAI